MYTVRTFMRRLEGTRRCDWPEFLGDFRSEYATRWLPFLEEVFNHPSFSGEIHGSLLSQCLRPEEQIALLCRLDDRAAFLQYFATPIQVSRLYAAIDAKNSDHSLFLRWAITEAPETLKGIADMFDILLSGGEIEQ